MRRDALGRGADYLQTMRPPVLAAVPGRRYYYQPLTQRADRRVVVVTEALVKHISGAPRRRRFLFVQVSDLEVRGGLRTERVARRIRGEIPSPGAWASS